MALGTGMDQKRKSMPTMDRKGGQKRGEIIVTRTLNKGRARTFTSTPTRKMSISQNSGLCIHKTKDYWKEP